MPYHDPRNTWPAERIIAALKKLARNGERPPIEKVGQALYKVACARFGTFEKACRRAGLLPRSKGPGLAETVDEFERQCILRALRAHDGNIQRTAEALQLKRQSLQRKMRRLKISDG